MRTLAAKMTDEATRRYAEEDASLDPTVAADAKKMLASVGGSKAAKHAIAELFAQASKPGQGWLPTARISAPMRVLMAMTTVGVLEMADDNEERETRAIRFRLTESALDMAVKGIKGK